MKRSVWSLLVPKDLQTSNLSFLGQHKLSKLTDLSTESNKLLNLLIRLVVNLFTSFFNFTPNNLYALCKASGFRFGSRHNLDRSPLTRLLTRSTMSPGSGPKCRGPVPSAQVRSQGATRSGPKVPLRPHETGLPLPRPSTRRKAVQSGHGRRRIVSLFHVYKGERDSFLFVPDMGCSNTLKCPCA